MHPVSKGFRSLSGELVCRDDYMRPCGPPSPALLQLLESLKASFEAFKEAKLPMLKEENPSLSDHQYKVMISRLWNLSPENPLRQGRTIMDMLEGRPGRS